MRRPTHGPRMAWAPLLKRIKFVPHQAQAAVMFSEARFRVCVWGVRAGKTSCSAVIGLREALSPGDKLRVVWFVAPSYELCDKTFREVQRYVETYFPELVLPRTRWSDRKLLLRNLGGGVTEVRGKSADNPESLLGEGVDFMVVDEASRIDATVWEEYLVQRLIDKRGRALLISTPKGRNWYWAAYMRGQPGPDKDPDWESWRFPSWVNPLLPREDIEAERARLPASSFRQEFEASFEDGDGQVFQSEAIQACARLHWPSSKGLEPFRGDAYQRPERFFAGLDLASTTDFTVLVVMNARREVVFIDRMLLSHFPNCPRILS